MLNNVAEGVSRHHSAAGPTSSPRHLATSSPRHLVTSSRHYHHHDTHHHHHHVTTSSPRSPLPEYLDQIRSTLGFKINLISQQVEAELGFMTAAAFDGQDAVAWDSGGGSFQICAKDPATAELQTYLGALGTASCGGTRAPRPHQRMISPHLTSPQLNSSPASPSPAHPTLFTHPTYPPRPFMLTPQPQPYPQPHPNPNPPQGIVASICVVDVQGSNLTDKPSPNPCTTADVERLVGLLKTGGRLPSDPPSWISEVPVVTAIGGPNSIFALACKIAPPSAGREGHVDLEGVREAIAKVAGKEDHELSQYSGFMHADPAKVHGQS